MAEARRWTVSELAARAHVTVRTLHHYDTIGLLVPSARSAAGYRLYAEADLERLFRILLYRELGFSLEAIGQLLDAPVLESVAALSAQRKLLREQRRKTAAIIRALDRTLTAIGKGEKMSEDEMFEGFDAFADAPAEVRAEQAKYGQEVRERWGDTDAYRESLRRARQYSKAEWQRIQAEGEANEARMAELLAAGADPEGEAAMAGAEAMRLQIDRWFYPCPPARHACVADMYEADARFAQHFDQRAPGLASFVARAIRANARRAEQKPAS